MKITVSQQPVFRDHFQNLECTMDVLEANKDTDWLLTPECAVSGYCLPPTLNHTFNVRTQQVEAIIQKIKDKAAEYNVNLALGSGIKDNDGYPYNAMLIYDEGNLVSMYKKRIITRGWEGGGEHHHYLAGHVPNYFHLDKDKTILASSMICNDFWCMPRVAPGGNPYHHVQLAQNGVDVIFVSSNCNGEERDELAKVWNESHLQIFAREFGMYVVHAGSATSINHKETDFLQCASGVIGPDGEWIAKCKDLGMDSVTVDLDIKPRFAVEQASSHIFVRKEENEINS